MFPIKELHIICDLETRVISLRRIGEWDEDNLTLLNQSILKVGQEWLHQVMGTVVYSKIKHDILRELGNRIPDLQIKIFIPRTHKDIDGLCRKCFGTSWGREQSCAECQSTGYRFRITEYLEEVK